MQSKSGWVRFITTCQYYVLFDESIIYHNSIMNIYDVATGKHVDRDIIVAKSNDFYICLHPYKAATSGMITSGSLEQIPVCMQGLPITRKVQNNKTSGLYRYYIGKEDIHSFEKPCDLTEEQIVNITHTQQKLDLEIYRNERSLKLMKMNLELLNGMIKDYHMK